MEKRWSGSRRVKAEEGKRAEKGERERERRREERGGFSINSFARKRLFLPMIYGFAIDGSSLHRPILERARACSESVTKARVLYAHVCTRCGGKYECSTFQ